MTTAAIMVRMEEPGWRGCGVGVAEIRAAARLALARGVESRSERKEAHRKTLTILLAGDGRLRELNARFRGNNRPTNVLSFPAPSGDDYLGDIALALGVAGHEAGAAGKRLADHVLHLTVHGVLHLLGYDHQRAREARTMERLEIAILQELGIANPYAQPVAAE
jgi:probable rRNA maturation factor